MRDPLRFLCAALISALAVAESSAAVPGEKELRGRLPGVFSRIEKQYRAMEALVEAQPAERNLPIDVCNGRNRFGSVFDWTSGFYPGWHTTHDTVDQIDRATLQAVGQTLATLIYEY